jgi:large-conductance mechanosensitive channel
MDKIDSEIVMPLVEKIDSEIVTPIVKDIDKTTRTVYQDFREFAVKQNIIGLATGWIIGISTAQLIRSFVVDIFSPLFGTGKFLKYKVIKLGKIKINAGNFVLELLNWGLMLVLVFIFVEYFFNRRIIKMQTKFSDKESIDAKQNQHDLKIGKK